MWCISSFTRKLMKLRSKKKFMYLKSRCLYNGPTTHPFLFYCLTLCLLLMRLIAKLRRFLMYSLKTNKLKLLKDCPPSSTSYVVIVLCGSFNPFHCAHIGLFEAAKKELESPAHNYAVLGGFVSAVADAYGKPGLAPFADRERIIAAAVSDHPNLEVDNWEGLQLTFTRTFFVLSHLQETLVKFYQVREPEMYEQVVREGKQVEVVLVGGADIFGSFFIPKAWPLNLLQRLVDNFRMVFIERKEGGVRGEEDARRRMQECAMSQEIDGEVYYLSFSTAKEILFTTFSSPDDTCSTQIRNLVSSYWSGGQDAAVWKELEAHMPLAAIQLTLDVYRPK